MARESWLDVYGLGHDRQSFIKALEAFEELVRADEREQIAQWYDTTGQDLMRHEVPDAIRARREKT
jgi:hypothetical protein